MTNNKLFQISIGLFKWLSITIFLLSLFVFIINLVNKWSVPIEFNINGINNLFLAYSPTIKIFTYFLGTFAIYLTLSRMAQTQKQIDVIESNNRFNNFFKHREQFLSQFKKNPFFIEYEVVSKENCEADLLNLYSHFYYKSHFNFTPFMNEEYQKIVYNFMNNVQKSSLNMKNQNLDEISYDEVYNVEKLNEPRIRKFPTYISSKLGVHIRKLLEEREITKENISKTTRKFPWLNEIYWTLFLYKSLMAFDGNDKFTCENFLNNFTIYQINIEYDMAKAISIRNN